MLKNPAVNAKIRRLGEDERSEPSQHRMARAVEARQNDPKVRHNHHLLVAVSPIDPGVLSIPVHHRQPLNEKLELLYWKSV